MLRIKHQSAAYVNIVAFQNLNNFHALEVVDHVSEIQLQVCENFNLITFKGLKSNERMCIKLSPKVCLDQGTIE